MRWENRALFLSARAYGERGSIASVFTENHGRYCGYVHGAKARRTQPGQLVAAQWSARHDQQLGTLKIEAENRSFVGLLRLDSALVAASAALLLEWMLPEREPNTPLWEKCAQLIEALDLPTTQLVAHYIDWEVFLLKRCGYGLDLESCALSGQPLEHYHGQAWVSPNTGRAATQEAIERTMSMLNRDRLLILPAFLKPGTPPTHTPGTTELLDGLALTSYFLGKTPRSKGTVSLPATRQLLGAQLQKQDSLN